MPDAYRVYIQLVMEACHIPILRYSQGLTYSTRERVSCLSSGEGGSEDVHTSTQPRGMDFSQGVYF